MQFSLVTDGQALPAIIAQYRTKAAVAIDTEFARFNTYYPIVGLVQIYDGESCHLIDPVAVGDLSPLADLLVDESVVKVLHSCSEDVEVFCDALQVAPGPIFDTQIAAALLGVGFSVSYQNLVNHYLGIMIPKEETRSDWLQRPLTDSQLEYAALDVTHLLTVYETQVEELDKLERASWVTEECAQLAEDIPTQIDPNRYFYKVKNLWRLDRKQLQVLKDLCAWRERTARDRNLPRNRIVDEKTLFQMAAKGLKDKQGFREAGMTSRQLKFHGDDLISVIAKAEASPPEEYPPLVPKISTPISSQALRSLKQVVDHCAAELNIAPEMLAKRRHLEQLIRSKSADGDYKLPKAFSGWREAVIGEVLLKKVAEQ